MSFNRTLAKKVYFRLTMFSKFLLMMFFVSVLFSGYYLLTKSYSKKIVKSEKVLDYKSTSDMTIFGDFWLHHHK